MESGRSQPHFSIPSTPGTYITTVQNQFQTVTKKEKLLSRTVINLHVHSSLGSTTAENHSFNQSDKGRELLI